MATRFGCLSVPDLAVNVKSLLSSIPIYIKVNINSCDQMRQFRKKKEITKNFVKASEAFIEKATLILRKGSPMLAEVSSLVFSLRGQRISVLRDCPRQG